MWGSHFSLCPNGNSPLNAWFPFDILQHRRLLDTKVTPIWAPSAFGVRLSVFDVDVDVGVSMNMF